MTGRAKGGRKELEDFSKRLSHNGDYLTQTLLSLKAHLSPHLSIFLVSRTLLSTHNETSRIDRTSALSISRHRS